MYQKNNIHRLLVEQFVPFVYLDSQTLVKLNNEHYPKQEQILSLLWKSCDKGHIHCCKSFQEQVPLPKEIFQEIRSFLYQDDENISVVYARLFWNSMYIDQLMDKIAYYEYEDWILHSTYKVLHKETEELRIKKLREALDLYEEENAILKLRL